MRGASDFGSRELFELCEDEYLSLTVIETVEDRAKDPMGRGAGGGLVGSSFLGRRELVEIDGHPALLELHLLSIRSMKIARDVVRYSE